VVVVSYVFKLAAVAALSAVASAAAMTAIAGPQTLRIARLDAQGFAAGPAAVPAGSIAKAADGHFWADAEVGAQVPSAQKVRFLVDTGATAVALTQEDAARLGFKPRELNYGYNITTAGGGSRAAAVTLTSVSINGARIENVQALVVADGLDVSLLGMSYLGRLTRFEATRQTLRFEP
jgi:aspartyl protease family protein